MSEDIGEEINSLFLYDCFEATTSSGLEASTVIN